MATVRAIFLLPAEDTDGRDLESEIDAARADLWACFSAYTSEGEVEGVYKMADGSKSDDTLRMFSLVLDDARVADLEQILRDFKAKTRQEAIYLEIQHAIELRLI